MGEPYTGVPVQFNAAVRSTDGGATWEGMVRLDSNPFPKISGAQVRNWGGETYFMQARGDGVVAVIRNTNSPTAWFTRSRDAGRSWSPLSRAPFFACAAATLTTASGVMLIAGRGDGTTVAASWDDGTTWQLFVIEAGTNGGNGAMHEVEPDVVLFVGQAWDVPQSPPHYFRLRVEHEPRAIRALSPQ